MLKPPCLIYIFALAQHQYIHNQTFAAMPKLYSDLFLLPLNNNINIAYYRGINPLLSKLVNLTRGSSAPSLTGKC